MRDYPAMQARLLADIEGATDAGAVEALRVAALGKAGSVSALLKTLGDMSPEERQVEGPRIHALRRSEEHTSELQSLMRTSYAVFCLKKKKLQQLVAQNI